MPRTARKNRPGLAFHIIWRFVDRAWYFTCDEERDQYLRLLGRALAFSDWRCFAYALMSSHVHLYMLAGTAPMYQWSKRAHSYFAQWLNKRHGRLGAVFADRPQDHAFLRPGEPNLLAYIHNNPVRAGVVARARESTWTSQRAYLGLVLPPSWLRVEEGLARTGLVDVDLDVWAASTPGTRRDLQLSARRKSFHMLGAIEPATPLLGGDSAMLPLVARPFAHVRVPPLRVIEVVCELTGYSRLQLGSTRRGALSNARTIVAHVGAALGVPKSHLAATLGLSAEGLHRAGNRGLADADKVTVETALDWLRLEWNHGSRR